jgi:EAL and modified HD-GYP domain-containing signal transduction protein
VRAALRCAKSRAAGADHAGVKVDTPVDVLAARHPIYDGKLRVAAYELVLHSRDEAGVLREGHGAATPEAIAAIAEDLVGSHPVHVKVSRDVLLSGAAHLLPSERIVLEVPHEVGYDDELATSLRALARTGHVVVLDGFRFSEDAWSVLNAARLVKLHVGSLTPQQLEDEVALIWPELQGGLVAAGVETHETLQHCRELGFGLFQGFFFLRPKVDGQGEPKPHQLTRMRLLGQLQDPDPDFDRLQAVIATDIVLSYALLRFVNAAFFALPRAVESVRDAAVLLGVSNIRRWATLTVLAETGADKPGELMVTGLTRARMCELLAPAYGQTDCDAFFTTGLFSIVDALMDIPMIQVLSELPFSKEINGAILNFEGPKGRALRAALAWEEGNLSELTPPAEMTVEDVGATYREAVAWAASAAAGLV